MTSELSGARVSLHVAPSGTPQGTPQKAEISQSQPKPLVVFGEVENLQDQEWNLSGRQLPHEGASKAGGDSQEGRVSQKVEPQLGWSVDHSDLDSDLDNWVMAGSGQAKVDCGKTLVFGCLNVEDHIEENYRIDGSESHAGKVYVDLRRHSCMRLECPVCYEKAAAREAHHIEHRMKAWRSRGKPIHYVESVPRSLWHLPIEKLREKAYKVARSVGFWGGSCIVHKKRERCKICGEPKDGPEKQCLNCGYGEFIWYFSPHFHMIGYGWISGEKVAKEYARSGWVSKKIGATREEEGAVFKTAMYQLSHCSTKKNRHTVTWFGAMAYNKLKVEKEIVIKKICPLCGSELEALRYLRDGPLPFTEEGDHYGDLEDWGRRSVPHFQSSW
jgi:hypothetical protein